MKNVWVKLTIAKTTYKAKTNAKGIATFKLSKLSKTSNEILLSPEIIERYKDFWDWQELSDNSDLKLSYELIDKYIDRWDWAKLINGHWREEEIYSLDFLKRYQQYIPVDELEDSSLWYAIVDEAVENIKKDMIFGK